MSNANVIIMVVAIFLALAGTVTRTKDVVSGIYFNFLPLLSAFLLGLIAFGVIQ